MIEILLLQLVRVPPDTVFRSLGYILVKPLTAFDDAARPAGYPDGGVARRDHREE